MQDIILEQMFKEYEVHKSDVRLFIIELSKEYGLELQQKEQIVSDTIIVNTDYLKKILTCLEEIEDILLLRDYKGLKETLEEIILKDDFEDSEEVISKVHKEIEDRIIGSFTKVKKAQREILKNFLKNIGYQQKSIPKLSSIKDYISYFEKTYQEKKSKERYDGLIKSVDRTPYILKYDNDGEIEELCLRGECTYYVLDK